MRRLIPLALSIALVSGCQGAAKDGPPAIRYGEDLCRQCHMSIDDARYACVLIDRQGLVQRFDDIGCMKAFEMESDRRAEMSWVHDHAGADWVERAKAYFVVSGRLQTPMGYGAAAFAELSKAEDFCSKYQGEQVSWDDLGSKLHKTDPWKSKEGSQ